MTSAPSIVSYAAIVGKKEGEGPLAKDFDVINEDTTFGEKTWEKAESRLQQQTAALVLQKAQLATTDIDVMFAGDLLNQCIGSIYGLRELDIPYFGLFGACSTMAESLVLASLFVDNALAGNALALTSSHFCSAERQFRLPLEYGGQRPPSAQWTVTGSGAAIVSGSQSAPYVRAVAIGRMKDMGIKDANNMGAAMAPAAAQTIKNFLDDTQTQPSDYSLILTGDLGAVGSDLLIDLLKQDKIDISKQHNDCGKMIFDPETQDVHAGGSGCGCSASVLCGSILKRVASGELPDVLFVATGALMSTTSSQQGESIPGIAHLLHISNKKG